MNDPVREVFRAVREGNPGALSSLVSGLYGKYYASGVNEHGQTPLDVALAIDDNRGNVDYHGVFHVLLYHGDAYVTVENVLSAAQLPSHAILRLLCDSGENVINRPTNGGWNPLQTALYQNLNVENQLWTVNALLSNGADPNVPTPWPALHVAVCYNRSPYVIDDLLKQQANPNAFNQFGQTVLHAILLQRRSYNFEAFRMLVNYGGNVNIGDLNGCTVLHHAILMKTECYTVHYLLFHTNADCRACTNERKTALHLYAMVGEKPTWFNERPRAIGGCYDRSIFTALLQTGADINALDQYGATPLYYAANYGHEDIVQALLRAGADPNLSHCTDNNGIAVPQGDQYHAHQGSPWENNRSSGTNQPPQQGSYWANCASSGTHQQCQY